MWIFFTIDFTLANHVKVNCKKKINFANAKTIVKNSQYFLQFSFSIFWCNSLLYLIRPLKGRINTNSHFKNLYQYIITISTEFGWNIKLLKIQNYSIKKLNFASTYEGMSHLWDCFLHDVEEKCDKNILFSFTYENNCIYTISVIRCFSYILTIWLDLTKSSEVMYWIGHFVLTI